MKASKDESIHNTYLKGIKMDDIFQKDIICKDCHKDCWDCDCKNTVAYDENEQTQYKIEQIIKTAEQIIERGPTNIVSEDETRITEMAEIILEIFERN